MRMYFLLFFLVAFSVGLYGQEAPEELTPDDIIEMIEAGLSDSLIIQKIRISTLLYEPNVQDIVELRKAGASERIIQAVMGISSPMRTVSGVRYRTEDRGTYPRFELFGGYSYARGFTGGFNLWNGWNASITNNINDWLGIVTDISGHNGSPFERVLGIVTRKNVYTLTFGPQISIRVGRRVIPFVRGLVGFSHERDEVILLGFSDKQMDTGLAYGFGGGLDVTISENLALRVAQVDYGRIRSFGEGTNNLRVSVGIVGKW